MSVYINIDHPFKELIDKSRIKKITKRIFDQFRIEELDLSINIVNDKEIKSLNKQFRKSDSTTDVLSFPADEKDPLTGKKYLGDVIISYPQVLRQAEENNQSSADELAFVIIHGILHLLNYDHQSKKEERTMLSLQNSILRLIK